MDTQPAFGFQELLTHVVGDMARAVSERPGETRREHHARSQAAVHMIMGFLPRDVIEAILAGRCVMFHEMMTDSVRDTMRGEVDSTRRATRGTIAAMDKAFGANLTRLEHYRSRPAEGSRDMPEERPVETAAQMEPEDRTPRAERATPPSPGGKRAVPPRPREPWGCPNRARRFWPRPPLQEARSISRPRVRGRWLRARRTFDIRHGPREDCSGGMRRVDLRRDAVHFHDDSA